MKIKPDTAFEQVRLLIRRAKSEPTRAGFHLDAALKMLEHVRPAVQKVREEDDDAAQ